MANVNNGRDLHVRVVSRRLVTASDSSTEPRVLDFSNIDLINGNFPVSFVCIYPKPPTGSFDAVVTTFAAGLPSLLNHFFPFAGRIVTNQRSGLPEVLCNNQGAELVVGEANVALASLDFGMMDSSVGKIPVPYGGDVALSVQVVSFACGGFSVAWGTNNLLVDGHGVCMLVSAWSELARTGALAAGARPIHDRSVFRPRATPSTPSSSLDVEFRPLDGDRLVNVLTSDASFVRRLYYVDARDISRLREIASRGGERATRVQAVSAYMWKALASVVGAADARCRMGWWMDGRRRLTEPEHRAAMRSYVGNVATFALREARVEEIQRKPLQEVASMVREATTAQAYGDRFQELVDWVEAHKTASTYVEAPNIGLGSPTIAVASLTSFPLDTDFGVGRAAMAMPTSPSMRLCSGFVQMVARPGGDGSWLVRALLWPKLAAALESDEQRIFRPVTAAYLGLKPQPLEAVNVKHDDSPLSRL